ncbi:hypothetical protein [Nodularia sp. NIES-3585]|uniref:hypothetical protein n=1 Tax=Nodularia sp. NIES-3585 TaxID=1973477 RepID=UPI000B5CC184|nr:hypothetical protein [Nodularia sp. NIES-3585]
MLKSSKIEDPKPRENQKKQQKLPNLEIFFQFSCTKDAIDARLIKSYLLLKQKPIPKRMGVWRNGRRYGLRKLGLDREIFQVEALKFRET